MKISLILLAAVCAVAAHAHDDTVKFGAAGGKVVVTQPQPMGLRDLSHPLPTVWALNLGFDIDTVDAHPQLNSVRAQCIYISPGLKGQKTGVGDFFCPSGCQNYLNIPPHTDITFVAQAAGVFAFDIKGTNGVEFGGASLGDMDQNYRIYFVAGPINQIYGSVQTSAVYVGPKYGLPLTVSLRTGSTTVAQVTQPINPEGIYAYDVGFTQAGSYDVVAKLSKHLSRRLAATVVGATNLLNLTFPYAGDLDGDDQIGVGDLNSVLVHFATSDPGGDVDGDGVVALPDLNTILVNFTRNGEGKL